jgi:glycosyltransferase involved in cell wall biosynthesis
VPVRVASVITRLARGGSERRLYDVLRAIPAEHLVVVGRDSDPRAIEAVAADHEVMSCTDLVRSVDPRRDGRALVRLVSILRARSVDVVHTHQSKAGLLGRVAARSARVPIVYHSASMASFGPGYGRAESSAFAIAERLTAPLVSRYFVVGTDLADRLAANGVSRRRLQVVRSSLDLRAFVPATPDEVARLRATLGVVPERPVVSYVGSLDERKGVLSLPDVVERAARGRPVTLLVAGDGPGHATLDARRAHATRGVELVLLGHVDDVASVMRASDLLVLPSSAEGLPQVLVQAASCGLPFAAYEVDGVRELVSMGAEGRVVPVGDTGALGSAISAELDLVPRPRPRPADAAAWSAWDPATVAEQYRAAYEQDLAHPLDGSS